MCDISDISEMCDISDINDMCEMWGILSIWIKVNLFVVLCLLCKTEKGSLV